MAFKEDRLQLFNVKQSEIRDAFYSCHEHCDGEVEFCTCKPWKLASISVDYDVMKEAIKEYYVGYKQDGYVYGILIYKTIINSLRKMLGNNNHDSLDIRIFRMLWEHKYLMRKHLEKLGEKMEIQDVLERASDVEMIGNQVFRLAIKHSVNESDKTLNSMINKLESMERMEREYLSKIVVRMF